MGTCGDRGVNGTVLCYGAYWTTKLQSPTRVSKFTYNLETCDMEYAFAVAIMDKVVKDHCNHLMVKGQNKHDPLTPASAAREVEAVKNAYDKVRNG